jgi:hypothetical protein
LKAQLTKRIEQLEKRMEVATNAFRDHTDIWKKEIRSRGEVLKDSSQSEGREQNELELKKQLSEISGGAE